VGLQPTRIIHANGKLYVANSNSDSVSIIDVKRRKVVQSINTRPFAGAILGSSPTSIAYHDNRLYVTLGHNNAVAVYQLPPEQTFERAAFLGMIPTAWYPGDIVIDTEHARLVVANVKGIGSQGPKVIGGPGMTVQGAVPTRKPGKWAYSHTGTVSIIDMPDDDQLATYSRVVLQNNNMLDLAGQIHGQRR